MLIIEIKNLTVQYPDVKALDNISFGVDQGDFLGIIGPNGAGKSTLFDSMLGLNTKYEGTIKFFNEDIFMLWQSENTVVVGKHQNAMAEINYSFVRDNNIKVARRISGGGTVFHDAGNVNFAYIKNVASPAEISFKIFTEPVVKALSKIGITATASGRRRAPLHA